MRGFYIKSYAKIANMVVPTIAIINKITIIFCTFSLIKHLKLII